MNLKELAAAAQKAANETKGRGNGVLTVTVEKEDIVFAAGGDRDAIVQGLATVLAEDDNAKALIIEALKLSEQAGEKCNCPACQLREALEEMFEARRDKRKSDPSVN